MERLTHEADFGFEDWEETLFFVKSDPNGAYNILDIAKYQGEEEFDKILINIAIRLADIENILGDDYDLDRLRELVQADRDRRCMVLPAGGHSNADWIRSLDDERLAKFICESIAKGIKDFCADAGYPVRILNSDMKSNTRIVQRWLEEDAKA